MGELLSLAEQRDVLRFSLRASTWSTYADFTSATAGGPEINPNNPAVRRLVQHILFSRQFILTYFLAIGVFVILRTVQCQRRRTARQRKICAQLQETALDKKQNLRQLQVQHDDSGSTSVASSSSSTLQEVQSPPFQSSSKSTTDEQTSLVGSGHANRPILRFYDHLMAFFMYQPAPIPALTSSKNFLPDNGAFLLITVFMALNIFYLFYRTPLSIPMLFAFADRAGLCFVANLPVLYTLSAKNNQPIKWLTGWSYEALNMCHRRLGEWMIVLALLHTCGMFGVWYTLLRPVHFTLQQFLSSRVILLGLFAFLAYSILLVTSTGIVRQFYYEHFLGLHISVQFAALVLLFFHHSGSRPYVLAALVIWAVDRILFRNVISPVKLRADLKVAADKETVLLLCDVPIQRASPCQRSSRQHIFQGWHPGQHVFVTIPNLGFTHKLQAHPFTIASPAPPNNYKGTWPLQLIIRAKGGFSKDLLNFTQSQASAGNRVEIVLDGPYGSNETLQGLSSADRVFLLAGGSGIAVTYPYAWALLVRNRPKALMRQNSDPDERTLADESLPAVEPSRYLLQPRSKEFHHVWVRALRLHQLWLVSHPARWSMMMDHDGQYRTKCDNTNASESAPFGNLFSLSPSSAPTQESGAGRPDLAWELRKWVEADVSSIGGQTNGKARTICVVVSGPDGMVRDVRNAAAGLVAEGWNIDVHVEKFGW